MQGKEPTWCIWLLYMSVTQLSKALIRTGPVPVTPIALKSLGGERGGGMQKTEWCGTISHPCAIYFTSYVRMCICAWACVQHSLSEWVSEWVSKWVNKTPLCHCVLTSDIFSFCEEGRNWGAACSLLLATLGDPWSLGGHDIIWHDITWNRE